jgi:hypothetical protein
MSVLTRIKNNQILDSTIYANAKIVPGSIVGSLFNTNLTMTSDVTITGNLTVQGSSTYLTVASTNTFVNDPLIVMNNAFSGTNTYDLGFIFNRGSLLNQALIWNEYSNEFRFVGTTESGTTYGNINQTSFANVSLGNLDVIYSARIGAIISEGGIEGANLNVSGNVLASTVGASFLTASTATIGNISAVTFGNTGAVFTGASVNMSGNVSAATLIAGQINTTGNVLASTVGASYLTASTATIGNISAVTIGNAGAYLTGGNLNITGNVLGGLAQFSAINSTPIGNATPSTAAFTTLTASGLTTLTNTTPATGLGTGALQVSGGTSIAGNLWVGGNLNVVGNSFTIISNAGVFYGDANGFGALYAGTPGYTPLPQTVLQTSADFNGYAQNNFENLNTGAQASTDWVATAGDGGDVDHYIDMGITTANWDGTQDNSLTNALAGNDGYMYVQGNVTTGQGGNLVVGASTPGTKKVSVIVGGNTASSITAVFRNPNTQSTTPTTGALTVAGGVGITGNAVIGANLLAQGAAILQSSLTTAGVVSFTDITNSTGVSTGGALTVAGGAAIAKDLWVGGNVYAANIIGTSYQYLTIVDPLVNFRANVTYPYNYDIGFYSSFVGGPANVEATSGVVRDDSDGVWKFFSNVSEPAGGTLTFNSDTLWDGIKAGNLFLTDATASSTTGTGALIVTGGAGIGGSLYARDIQATVIGNVSPAAGFFTQLNSTGNVVATDYRGSSLNVTGNVSASGGIFATVGVTGGIWANSSTESTSTSTGSIVSAGGLGLAGNIFQGGAYLDTSASNYIFASTPATVDAFKAATNLEFGATSGTLTINNPTVVGSQVTQNLYNTVATAINFAGEANVTMGTPSGVTTVRGGANVRATTGSATYTTGALTVAGGVGVAGNINIAADKKLIIGLELPSASSDAGDALSINGNNSAYLNASVRNLSNVGVSAYRLESDIGITALFGMVGSGYTDPTTRLTASTGYIQSVGTDFIVGAGGDVDITVGGTEKANVIASFSATNSNVTIYSSGSAITPRTGALTVAGGVGVGANLVVAGGAIFNYNKTSGNIVIKGKTNEAGVVYDVGNQHLFINGPGFEGNTIPLKGATFAVRSTDAMIVPVGSTAFRPSNTGNVDLTGMLRFNTTVNNLEWYNGSEWAVPGASTTVITSEQLFGNGVATAFTVNNASTTNSTIISINGVVQAPTTAYGIVGTTLTFTEAPAEGDLIEVRTLTTTSVISALTSSNGFNSIDLTDLANNYANITTGESAATPRISVTTDGIVSLVNNAKLANQNPSINIANSSAPYVLDTFVQTKFSTAKYVVQAKRGSTNIESMDAIVVTDGVGNAFVSVYGVINNGTAMGTLSANVLGGNVQLYYTSTSLTNSNVRVTTSYIK